MGWWDDYGGYIAGAAGGIPGYLGNSMLTNKGGAQDSSSVKGIGAGQTTDANGGVDLGHINLPYFEQDRNRLQGMLQGQTPFASQDWGGLISQLKDRAAGTGDSLAKQNYNMANQNTVNSISSIARGSGSPGAMQEAMLQAGRVGQGQAAGLATAGIQEQQAAQTTLGQTLNARDGLNQNAYLNILGQQLGLSMGQLRALNGDQQFVTDQNKVNQANEAAKYQALASLLAAGGKIGKGG